MCIRDSVNDVLVLPKGALGEGTIKKVVQPRSFGRDARIDVDFTHVYACLLYTSYAGGAVVADFGKFNASAGYYNFKDILAKNSSLDNAIWFVGAGTEFGLSLIHI